MIIPIDDEYRIASDRHQWILQKAMRKKRDGQQLIEWNAESYYPSFDAAICALGEALVRRSDAVGFADALLAVKSIVTTLSQALPTHINVSFESELDGTNPDRTQEP